MPPKKKPLPLHVSLYRIQEENKNKNLERRTKVRLAALLAEQKQNEDSETQYPSDVVQNER
jgi:hypothetical protein